MNGLLGQIHFSWHLSRLRRDGLRHTSRARAISRGSSLAFAVGIALLLTSSTSTAADGGSAEDAASPPKLRPHIAECGVASVYCALEELGIQATETDLRSHFTRVHGSDDLSSLTIEELVKVLNEYGVKASAVKVDPPDVDKVPTPAILYVSPQFRTRILGTGHFALLADVNEEFGTMIDLTMVGDGREDGVVEVHKGRLRNVWKGEAIVFNTNSVNLSRMFTNRNLELSAALLLAVSIFVGVGARRQSTKHSNQG